MTLALFQLGEPEADDDMSDAEHEEAMELEMVAASIAKQSLKREALLWLAGVASSAASLDMGGKRSDAAVALSRLGLDLADVRDALRSVARRTTAKRSRDEAMGDAEMTAVRSSDRAGSDQAENSDDGDSLDDARQEDEDSDGNLAGFVVGDDDDELDDDKEDEVLSSEDEDAAQAVSSDEDGVGSTAKRAKHKPGSSKKRRPRAQKPGKPRLRRHRASSVASSVEAERELDAGASAGASSGAVDEELSGDKRKGKKSKKSKKSKKTKSKAKKHAHGSKA